MFSYYRLHSFIQPGGARKSECYLTNSINELYLAIKSEISAESLFYLIECNETILLSIIIDGITIKKIELNPFIVLKKNDKNFLFVKDDKGEWSLDCDNIVTEFNYKYDDLEIIFDFDKLSQEILLLNENLLIDKKQQVNNEYSNLYLGWNCLESGQSTFLDSCV